MVRLDIHEVFVWYITLSTFIIKEENWLEYVKSVTRNDERERFRMGPPIPSVPFIYICSSP